MEDTELIKIEGSVENLIYKSEDESYGVIEIDYDGELLTVTGDVALMNEGETAVFHGTFVNNPKYGRQFKAAYCKKSLPQTTSGMYKFLASGIIKGIGESLARKIVDVFGEDTFLVLEKEPERLSSISGISERKAKEVGKSFTRLFGIEKLMIFLSKYQINSSVAVKIWKEFGENANDVVNANPYVLCINDFGITFTESDKIAEDLGFEKSSMERLIAAIIYVVRHNTNNGYTCVPKDKLVATTASFTGTTEKDAYEALESAIESELLVSEYIGENDCVFLPPYYKAEKYIAQRIGLMLLKQEDEVIESEFQKSLSRMEERLGLSFAKKQVEAIKSALESNIFILTGGPGTGKTTTINAIIELMERAGKKVLLCAPTGRAAQRMEELTNHDAKTIHRLLEVDPTYKEYLCFRHNEKNPLKADMLIVDEMSMVDALIMESLVRAIGLKTKLVLVGDNDQIPSVGAGAVLKDLIDSKKIKTVHLNEIFRQAKESLIVTNAHKIVSGEMPVLTEKTKDFFFMSRKSSSDILELTRDLFVKRLPTAYHCNNQEDIQIICPTRVGEAGTTGINKLLQSEVNPKAPGKNEVTIGGVIFRENDKVMQTKNNYDILWVENEIEGEGIYNGDIGIIKSIDKAIRQAEIVFGEKHAVYTFDDLMNLEHAYAITVHKSQGSEFDYVILPLMPYNKSPIYYRNILYTAVTRAKKLLVIVGSKSTLEKMVNDNKKSRRYTGLLEFIKDLEL